MTSIITYNQLKQAYLDFVKNPPKDEFSRYIEDYSFTQSLINFAKQQGLNKDVFKYQKIQDKTVKKLKSLGIEFGG